MRNKLEAQSGVDGREGRGEWAVAGVAFLAAALIATAVKWGELGARFYAKVVPFFDSLSYQENFAVTAARSDAVGGMQALGETWLAGGNNVVLYRFFAAAWGGVLPATEVGLYVYLGLIHVAGALVLGLVTWRMTRATWAGLWAVAAWLLAEPFSVVREGVLDQRMDLASASFYLMLAAMAQAWAREPSRSRAGGVGIILALAVLHRPVMAVSALVVVALFAIRAWRRHERSRGAWWREVLWMGVPGMVITLPWMLAHVGELYHYYVVANVDVGSAGSMVEAALYNGRNFMRAFGGAYAVVLAVGVGLVTLTRRLDWGDVAVVLLATLVSLLLLTLSRSTGNHLVCQLSLGVPALLLACGRGREELSWERIGGVVVAMAVLGAVLVGSIRELSARVEGESSQLRSEAEGVARRITERKAGARVATFHNAPVNIFALQRVARGSGVELNVGTLAYHPHHFGIPNERAAELTEEELTEAMKATVERVWSADDFLMLPAADAQDRLLEQPYSHRVIPVLRTLVEKDGRFVLAGRVGPMEGIEFDLFSIVR